MEPFLLFNENPKENFPFYLIQIGPLNRLMDFHLKGHPYVKSPIDMACWDILGKVRKQNELGITVLVEEKTHFIDA